MSIILPFMQGGSPIHSLFDELHSGDHNHCNVSVLDGLALIVVAIVSSQGIYFLDNKAQLRINQSGWKLLTPKTGI